MNSYNIKIFFIVLMSLVVFIATIWSWFIGELQVVAAFSIAVIVTFVIACIYVKINDQHNSDPFSFVGNAVILISVILVATPTHFIILMPLYYALKDFDYPVFISLPVMSILPCYIVYGFSIKLWDDDFPFIVILAVIVYSVLDSFFILLLIEMFKFVA